MVAVFNVYELVVVGFFLPRLFLSTELCVRRTRTITCVVKMFQNNGKSSSIHLWAGFYAQITIFGISISWNGLMAFYLCIFVDFVVLSFYIIVCRYDKYILRREKKKEEEKNYAACVKSVMYAVDWCWSNIVLIW